jgi:hypothetical protein
MASSDLMSRIVDLSEQYADRWVIFRALCRDGTRDEWVAEQRQPVGNAPKKITAEDVEDLADQLAAAEA